MAGGGHFSNEQVDEFYKQQVSATHKCQTCDSMKALDDYQKHTPSWCYTCDNVKTFEKLK